MRNRFAGAHREGLLRQRAIFFLVLIIGALSIAWLRMPPSGLVAAYYPNAEWRGIPVFEQVEKEFTLATFENLTAEGKLTTEQSSIAWNGWINIQPEGEYRFYTTSDDGSSIIIDGELVVDNGGFHGEQTRTQKLTLTEGMHRIIISYFNGTGPAVFTVWWKDLFSIQTPIPAASLFPEPLSQAQIALVNHKAALVVFYGQAWGCLLWLLCPAPAKRRGRLALQYLYNVLRQQLRRIEIVLVGTASLLFVWWTTVGSPDNSLFLVTETFLSDPFGVRLLRLALLLICLLGYCLPIASLFRMQIETVPTIVAALMIVLLHLAALAGGLLYMAYGLLILGVSGFLLFFLFRLRRPPRHRERLSDYLTPGMTLLLGFIVLSYLLFDSAGLHIWDEFSLWGLYPKEIILANGLPQIEHTAIISFSYPPGLAYFHYFAAVVLGYTEGHLLFAQQIVILMALIGLFHGKTWSRLDPALLLFIITCYVEYLRHPQEVWAVAINLSLIAIGLAWRLRQERERLWQTLETVARLVLAYGWSLFYAPQHFFALYADSPLGIYFGMALAAYLISPRTLSSVLLLTPIAAILPLIKPVGIFFALAVVSIVFVDQVLAWRRPHIECNGKSDWGIKSGSGHQTASLKKGVVMAIFILSPLLIYGSWSAYSNMQASASFEQDLQPKYLATTLSKEERKEITVAAFWNYFRERALAADIPRWTLLLFGGAILPAVIVICCEPQRTMRIRYLTMQALLFAGFWVYALLHLWLYMTLFSEYEGIRLASFGRYLGIYGLGWTFVFLAMLSICLAKREGHHWHVHAFYAILAIAVLILVPEKRWAKLPHNRERTIAEYITAIRQKIPLTAMVYHIWQNSEGMEHVILRYDLAPRVTNIWGWSLGKKYTKSDTNAFNEDIWTIGYNLPEWSQILHAYDYVVIGSADDGFWQTYGTLFERQGEVLYRVIKHADQTVSLRPVSMH